MYFNDCNNLVELNAKRIKLSATVDLVELNNEYNTRRQEILQMKSNYTVVPFTKVEGATPEKKLCAIPVIGKCQDAGVIRLTEKGFLF